MMATSMPGHYLVAIPDIPVITLHEHLLIGIPRPPTQFLVGPAAVEVHRPAIEQGVIGPEGRQAERTGQLHAKHSRAHWDIADTRSGPGMFAEYFQSLPQGSVAISPDVVG